MKSCCFLAAGLKPADVRVFSDLSFCKAEHGEDFLKNGVIVAFGKVNQLLCFLWLSLPLLDVQLGLHDFCLFVIEKWS